MKSLIILSAGHSTTESGAVFGNFKEADENIEIVKLCAEILDKQKVPYRVVPFELNLAETIKWINERYKHINDGLAIEVHKNAGGGKGIETFYFPGNIVSKDIAEKINQAIVQETGLENRGVKPDVLTRFGKLGFIRQPNVWSVLTEAGFIDTDDMKVPREKFASGIAKGIMQIFGLEYLLPKANKNDKIEKIKSLAEQIIKICEG